MSEAEALPPGGGSAGALLRAARQARGLHIAALAAAIKVTPAKLEALEEDRFDQLPDATFTRALAQTVCRALKIDAAPVLARLPQVSPKALDGIGRAEAPLRGGSGSRRDREAAARWQQPMWWFAGLLVIGAVALYLWPSDWTWERIAGAAKPAAQEAPVAVPPADVQQPATETTTAVTPDLVPTPQTDAGQPAAAASAPAVQPEAAPAAPASVAAVPAAAQSTATPLLQLRLRGESWVQVQEVGGKVLLSGLFKEGDAPALDGTPPFKVTIGNAGVAELRFRGEPVPLPTAAGAVARLELK